MTDLDLAARADHIPRAASRRSAARCVFTPAGSS